MFVVSVCKGPMSLNDFLKGMTVS
uniref:Uncharacterized protein n=1 Tax=Anguilla anguilla TaxID=7936 RepID=A0A0E9SX06_ANGAN